MLTQLECDVLCIGAGGGGIVAAVTAAERGARVIVLSKRPYGSGNTRIAGGLVLLPNISPEDSPEALMRDMVVAGEFLNNQALVETFCERAPHAAELMEQFGVIFSRKRSGTLAPLPVPLAGHGFPRTLTIYSEGVPIGTALRGAASRVGVQVLDETIAVRLIGDGANVAGAIALRWLTGEMVMIRAKQTILATGGLGWLYYPHTSNSRAMTGDGYVLALRAGAELVDMEQQQFIPFALTHPEPMVGIVCGEPAIAGPYGRLLDAKGRQILTRVRMKTRAQVSAAMSLAKEHGIATQHGGMVLDLTPNLKKVLGTKMFEFLKRTFPSMIDAVRRAYGEDAAKGRTPWDVFPTAHYQMGGIKVTPDCRVWGVKNLFAIGEVQGGLHGGNRIGSTSLAELFVFGSLAGNLAAEAASRTGDISVDISTAKETSAHTNSLPGKSGSHKPIFLVRRLQRILWENVGPIRDEGRLTHALEEIQRIREMQSDVCISGRRECNPDWLDAIELDAMLLAGEVIVRSALMRKESRGGHVRLDYTRRDDKAWLKNIVVGMHDDTLALRAEDVPLSRIHLGSKGGANPLRERIQFLILNILPRKAQSKILDARLNLGDDS
ncbi:MAG: FAD-binding protein [Candidatus Abyssobacteria bacterium SURF_17]|uniref:FAD-binding protein n=1 Tax=Candidatus Abyssobacteria bacterium SURF_17 TaxID=2093361 RepID=A0A419EZR1_9BACT|nr:MAG: FAD-binding protein [Candidatus Abyssubacteria bacterium SURF_17]